MRFKLIYVTLFRGGYFALIAYNNKCERVMPFEPRNPKTGKFTTLHNTLNKIYLTEINNKQQVLDLSKIEHLKTITKAKETLKKHLLEYTKRRKIREKEWKVVYEI